MSFVLSSGNSLEYVNERVFPVVSNQKYNQYFKEIGKQVDL
jgi:hypothetical protein